MTPNPSEHPASSSSDALHSFYLNNFHNNVEQSAIYRDVHFSSVNESDFAIVLTSQCDIQEHRPNNYVLLARIVPIGEVFVFWLIEKYGYTDDEATGKVSVQNGKAQRKSLAKVFADSYLRNETFAYHYLPKNESVLPPSLICFEITECISISNLLKHKKVAVPHSPYREAIPAHFSAYIGRIGTPPNDKESLRKIVYVSCKIT